MMSLMLHNKKGALRPSLYTLILKIYTSVIVVLMLASLSF